MVMINKGRNKENKRQVRDRGGGSGGVEGRSKKEEWQIEPKKETT